jgi:hypothetical protein
VATTTKVNALVESWKALEHIITHQIFSKQIGRTVKCKAKKKRINP